MESWIKQQATDELLKQWIFNSPSQKFVTSPTGEIMYANAAFITWSKYRMGEILKLNIADMCSDGGEIADDAELATISTANPVIHQKRQFRPKDEASQWGHLTVQRHPITGGLECLLCTWQPLQNGTASAFALAVEYGKTLEAKLDDVVAHLKIALSIPDDEAALMSNYRLAKKNPRWAMIILGVIVSGSLFQTIVTAAKTVGWLPTPVKVEKVDYDRLMGSRIMYAAVEQAAGSVADGGIGQEIVYTTASGSTVSWANNGGHSSPTRVFSGGSTAGSGRRGISGGVGESAVRGDGIDTLPIPGLNGRTVF